MLIVPGGILIAGAGGAMVTLLYAAVALMPLDAPIGTAGSTTGRCGKMLVGGVGLTAGVALGTIVTGGVAVGVGDLSTVAVNVTCGVLTVVRCGALCVVAVGNCASCAAVRVDVACAVCGMALPLVEVNAHSKTISAHSALLTMSHRRGEPPRRLRFTG